MVSRAHLYELARDLRRYLAWQGVDVDGYLPASDDERESFEKKKAARQQRQLEALRSQLGDESEHSSPEPGRRKSNGDGARDSTPAPREAAVESDAKSTSVENKDSAQTFDPTKTAADEAQVEATETGATGGDEVTSSTPLWKQHDALHDLRGDSKKGGESKPGDGKAAQASKPVSSPDGGGEPKTAEEKMAYLRNYLGDCTRCPLHEGRTNVVFGDGDPSARLMFVGEGPGRTEDQQGLPFVGPSGQLLTKMIEAMGLERGDVYITNVVKCRPPNNRNPAPLEIKECSPFLKKQIEVVDPEVIVTVGKFASNTLLDKDEALGRLRGRWHEHMGIPVMPTYHPAYLLRNEDDPRFKRRSWDDLKMVMARLGLGGK